MFTKAILLSFLLLTALTAQVTHASDQMSVVDIRNNIPLSDDEPTYKDFYINAGEADGLKKNLVITVTRPLAIRDASGAHTYGEINVPVGQLRILAVYGKVAVAREYKLLSREENPMLEQTSIMAGDKIELKGSFVDNKPSAKKKTVQANINPAPVPPAPQVTANIITVPVQVSGTNPEQNVAPTHAEATQAQEESGSASEKTASSDTTVVE